MQSRGVGRFIGKQPVSMVPVVVQIAEPVSMSVAPLDPIRGTYALYLSYSSSSLKLLADDGSRICALTSNLLKIISKTIQ